MSSTASDRARRLLALLQHLEPDADIELEHLADLVGSSAEVVAEDIGTLSMCGIAPYDPLNLVSVFVDEGRVIVMAPPPALDRPVRLSAGEARALTAALQAAGFDTGDQLLERLARASSQEFSAEELATRLRAESTTPSTEVYECLATALVESRVVTIEYQRSGESLIQSRTIEPISLFNDRGVWYVGAFCRSAEDTRTFRVDRVRSAKISDEVFDRRESDAEPIAFSGERLPTARLLFCDASTYSQREWPGSQDAALDETDGSLAVDVPYSGTDWIARQVCARLGEVTVESPPEVRAAVARMAKSLASELTGD